MDAVHPSNFINISTYFVNTVAPSASIYVSSLVDSIRKKMLQFFFPPHWINCAIPGAPLNPIYFLSKLRVHEEKKTKNLIPVLFHLSFYWTILSNNRVSPGRSKLARAKRQDFHYDSPLGWPRLNDAGISREPRDPNGIINERRTVHNHERDSRRHRGKDPSGD